MIGHAAELLLWTAVIFGMFAVLAFIAESLDRRDRDRWRLAMRAVWRRDWLVGDVSLSELRLAPEPRPVRVFDQGEIVTAASWNRTLDAPVVVGEEWHERLDADRDLD